MSRHLLTAAGLALTLVLAGPPARADQDDDADRARRAWQEAEDGQGEADEAPGPDAAPPRGECPDHDLAELLRLMQEDLPELMKSVEDRLFEADTGAFTQDEQRRIVEAMRFEAETTARLEELVHGLEHMEGT